MEDYIVSFKNDATALARILEKISPLIFLCEKADFTS